MCFRFDGEEKNDTMEMPIPQGYMTTKQWIDRHKGIYDSIEYIRINPGTKIKRTVPIQTEGTSPHRAFLNEQIVDSPETFVAAIPHGRVWGTSGFVITPDNILLSDVSSWFNAPPEANPIFREERLPKVHDIDGTVAVLSTSGWWNYYHWLFDSVPRYELLRKSGIKVDYYLVSHYPNSYQDVAVRKLGIPEERLIYVREANHYKAKRLIIPSLPGIMSRIPPWVCVYLRKTFVSKRVTDKRNRPRLYISRAKASGRKIVNEDDLLKYLVPYDFRIVYLEELSFLEQVQLFSKAEIIVAPHGAGLANLVFCEPGARVLELMGPKYINVMFWGLSSLIPLEYRYLIGEGDEPPAEINPFTSGNYLADFTVDIDKVDRQLKDWL
ncbi:glycosyltransferase family 61 protein [Heliobacterium chlorum]|uniref:Glycosyltransferase family 61 protein n=1 Tax=Heliobacterium chlorum TaxID=2698 RepID=A0ABR7T0D0_HELCL|nr:glycosyltransferase family 61 protein [Heliobacterium chlorum]MBC9783735.1 glycosyltransferase family 61 protein [Heliobacterium chlorum]